MQPQQAPKKKKNKLAIGCGVVAAIIVLFIIIGIANGGKSSTPTTPTSPGSNGGTSSSPTQSKPVTWTTTHTFTGNGGKKTESFTVGNDWKIQWSCNPGNIGMDAPLFITPYKTDGNAPLDMGSQTTCKSGQDTTGETEEHEGGTVYLNINSGIDWTITIQEPK
jgi:hypothetical protein